MRSLLALAVGVLLTAPAALAADGDKVSTSNSGDFRVETFLLCDGATGGATKTCAEFDTDITQLGQPAKMLFTIEARAGCAGNPAIIIQGNSVTGSSQVYDITTITVAGVESATLATPAHRFYQGDVTVGTGCTDLEVRMELHYKRAE